MLGRYGKGGNSQKTWKAGKPFKLWIISCLILHFCDPQCCLIALEEAHDEEKRLLQYLAEQILEIHSLLLAQPLRRPTNLIEFGWCDLDEALRNWSHRGNCQQMPPCQWGSLPNVGLHQEQTKSAGSCGSWQSAHLQWWCDELLWNWIEMILLPTAPATVTRNMMYILHLLSTRLRVNRCKDSPCRCLALFKHNINPSGLRKSGSTNLTSLSRWHTGPHEYGNTANKSLLHIVAKLIPYVCVPFLCVFFSTPFCPQLVFTQVGLTGQSSGFEVREVAIGDTWWYAQHTCREFQVFLVIPQVAQVSGYYAATIKIWSRCTWWKMPVYGPVPHWSIKGMCILGTSIMRLFARLHSWGTWAVRKASGSALKHLHPTLHQRSIETHLGPKVGTAWCHVVSLYQLWAPARIALWCLGDAQVLLWRSLHEERAM